MTPERWRQIEQIYHSALECDASQQSSFLKEACAGDEELRREVESMLAHKVQAESFTEEPTVEVSGKGLASQPSPLIGQQIGPYKVLSLLGVGGMGEVYKVRDTKLDRIDALKVLPADLACDQERMRRFVREAKAASALKHPNVATIYEIGASDGFNFIAMEYVEGQTLAARISGRPLDPADIVDIGIQVADALDEAHRKGITHRDIKPANLMLTPRGQVKVLDFGLAKVTQPEGQAIGSDISTVVKTQTGVVMGTAQYMSPEQVLGKEVDHRTDIFSVGAVLYEMATGRLPFSGSSVSETTDRILHGQPDAVARFNYNVPPELERIIRKCLEKDRDTRYQSTRELLIDLRNLKRDSDVGISPAEKAASERHTPMRRLTRVALAVTTLLVCLIGFYFLAGRGTGREGSIDSVAILPLVNRSEDPNAEYLTDGITESLINSLSQLPRLRVMARTTVFRYKGQAADPQKVGRELGVRAVLTGRVLQRGDTLNIQADLVDVADGSQLWGEQYNRKLADILVVQEEITKQISEKLQLRLSGEEKKQLAKRYTENTESYQSYLKGLYHWNKRTEDGLKKGIEYFQQAVDSDPNYALAYAGLADSYNMLPGYGVAPPRESFPLAKEAARRALRIDDTLAEAHSALAYALIVYDWQWLDAEREFKLAIKLNPTYASAHHFYALYLQWTQRHDEAIAEIKRALELDPLSLIINSSTSWVFCWARRYDEAIESALKGLELDPSFAMGHIRLGIAYEQKLMFEEAIRELEKAVVLTERRPVTLAYLARAYALAGKRSQARVLLDEAKDPPEQRYVSPYSIAAVYAALGEKDQAFAWLQKGYDERALGMVWLQVDPSLESLRSDPRFRDSVRRVGFPP